MSSISSELYNSYMQRWARDPYFPDNDITSIIEKLKNSKKFPFLIADSSNVLIAQNFQYIKLISSPNDENFEAHLQIHNDLNDSQKKYLIGILNTANIENLQAVSQGSHWISFITYYEQNILKVVYFDSMIKTIDPKSSIYSEEQIKIINKKRKKKTEKNLALIKDFFNENIQFLNINSNLTLDIVSSEYCFHQSIEDDSSCASLAIISAILFTRAMRVKLDSIISTEEVKSILHHNFASMLADLITSDEAMDNIIDELKKNSYITSMFENKPVIIPAENVEETPRQEDEPSSQVNIDIHVESAGNSANNAEQPNLENLNNNVVAIIDNSANNSELTNPVNKPSSSLENLAPQDINSTQNNIKQSLDNIVPNSIKKNIATQNYNVSDHLIKILSIVLLVVSALCIIPFCYIVLNDCLTKKLVNNFNDQIIDNSIYNSLPGLENTINYGGKFVSNLKNMGNNILNNRNLF